MHVCDLLYDFNTVYDNTIKQILFMTAMNHTGAAVFHSKEQGACWDWSVRDSTVFYYNTPNIRWVFLDPHLSQDKIEGYWGC